MAFRPMRWNPSASNPMYSWSSLPSIPSSTPKTLTVDQVMQLTKALQAKNSSHSFWDSVLHGAGGALSWTLDKLMRPNYAIATAIDKGFGYHSFDLNKLLAGAEAGITGQSHETFSDVFKNHGLLKGHGILRGVAGLGADIATDPVNLLSLVAAPETGGATALPLLSRIGLGGAEKASAFKIGKNFIDEAYHTLDPGIAEALAPKAQQAFHRLQSLGGSDFQFRKGLGVEQLNFLNKVKSGANIKPEDLFPLDLMRAGALAEEASKTKKAIQLQAKIPFGPTVGLTPKTVLGKRLLPVPAKLMESIAKKPVARILANAFIPGLASPVTHAALMMGQHGAERIAGDLMQHAQAKLDGVGKKLSTEEQLQALLPFTKEGGVVKQVDKATKEVTYHLNPNKFEGLTPAQAKFAEAFHSTMEHVRKQEQKAGVKYSGASTVEKGRMYVPHMVMKDDITFGGQRDRVIKKIASTRGFQLPKKMSDIEQILALRQAGKLPKDIITDPLELLGRRLRASASAQADRQVLRTMEKTMGIAPRKVDSEAVSKALKMLDVAKKHAATTSPMTAEEKAAAVEALKAQRKDEINKLVEESHGLLQRRYNRIKFGPKARTKKANLSRTVKAIENLTEHHANLHAQVDKGNEPGLQKLLKQHEKDAAQRAKDHKLAQSAVKEAEKMLQKAQKGKVNPELSKAKMAGYIQPKLGGSETAHHFPPEVAGALSRAIRVYEGDDASVAAIAGAYKKYLSKWKLLVTSVNPGYRIRNTLTDVWNMYVAGVPTWAMPVYGEKAARMMRLAKTGSEKMAKGLELSKKERAALLELSSASNHGALSGLFQGDIQMVRSYLEHAGSKKALLKQGRYVKLAEKIAQDMNRNAENWGRLTHYLYRRSQGMGAARAAREVRIAHFDYEDLTPFERNKLKAIMPFYTWTRKNIPYQLRQLASRPGHYSAFPKLAIESEKASGSSKGDILPGYMKAQFAFKTPFGYHIPQFGVSDLAVFNGDAKDHLLGMLSPFIKVPAELATGKSLTTGADLNKVRRVPVSGPAASLLTALDKIIPGNAFDVGPTKRGSFSGPGADWKVGYAASQIPLLNFLFNQESSVKKGEKGAGNLAPILNYLFGVNLTKLDNTQEAAIIEQQIKDYVKQLKRKMRDAGQLPEPKPRSSPFEKMLQAAIHQSYGR